MTRRNTDLNWIGAAALLLFLIPGARAHSQAQASSQAAPAKPAAKNPENPGQAKPAKKGAKKKSRSAKPEAEGKAGAKAEGKTEAKAEAPVSKRDPFRPLVAEKQKGNELPTNLPPGKAGLLIGSVHVDGTVRAPSGMLAVVSNPQQRVYFIHEGDRLYDGQVEHIGLDGVVFRQSSKDAFGRPVERLVTKRLYPSAGEQQ